MGDAGAVRLQSVLGPLGTLIGLADLPPSDTTRWVARRKAEILAAIRGGLIARDEACRRYSLSEEELRLWERAVDCAGMPGLRVTRVQIYATVFRAAL